MLVPLSLIIAVLASYVALDLGGRIRASAGVSRGTWLVTAAVALGGGIWSMHFVAMLAFQVPVKVTYDPSLTVVSLLFAVLVTGIGFKDSFPVRAAASSGSFLPGFSWGWAS